MAIKAFVKTEDSKMANVCTIIFSTVIAETVALVIGGNLIYDALLAVYISIITGIFYLIFSEGIKVIYNIDKIKVYSDETLVATGLLVATLFSYLGNFGLFGVTIRGIVNILIIIILGWKRGSAIGTISGISIGFFMGLLCGGNLATVATYAFSGFAAGILSKFGKIGAAIGFIFGNIIFMFSANGSAEMIASIKEIIVASIALFLMPKNFSIIIDNLFDYNSALPRRSVAVDI